MKITLAHSAGFCYGVRRAVKIAEDLANEGVSAVMLGPIIHNDAEIQRLGALGMETVDDPQDIPQGLHDLASQFNKMLRLHIFYI